MPSSHRRYAEWTPDRFRRWAGKIGPSTEGLITAVLASRPHPEQGFRTCLGILKLYRGVDADRAERCRPAPLRSAGSPAKTSPLSLPKKTTNPPRRQPPGDAVRSRQSARPRLLPLRGNPMLAHPHSNIARARLSWLGEGVQGARTKIRGARPRARGMARPAARIRNDAAPAETLRNARQSRPPAPFGQRRGCRLPQPARARPRLFLKLAACEWINERRNLLITGASGRERVARLRARSEGLPGGYTRPLLPRAQAVHRSGDRPWRRALRQAPAHDLACKTAHPRRLGARNAQPRTGARSSEIVEDRYDAGSLMITSQIPVDARTI